VEKYCSGAGHRWQYGASALHAGYLRLHTHSGCEILIALPIQLGLHESASMLRYTHSACLVKSNLFMILVSVHHPFCRYMSLPYPRSVTECQLPNVFSPSLPNDFSYHADVIITLQLHYEGGVASQKSFYIDPKYSIFYAHVKLLSSFLSRATALEGQDLLIIEASRSHSVKHATLGRTPLDEWSAWRRDLWQHTTLTRDISMPPAGFEPAIPASERPHTQALDRAATVIGNQMITPPYNPKLTITVIVIFCVRNLKS